MTEMVVRDQEHQEGDLEWSMVKIKVRYGREREGQQGQ
jgi:hypothetical protein